MADLKKRMEEGGISAQEVADAMASASAEGGRFFGGMDKASKTLSGRMSTLSDNSKMAIRSMIGIDQEGNIKEGGLFDRTSKNLEKLFPLMEKLANDYGPKIGDFFSKISKIGGEVFGQILTNMKPVFEYLKNNDTLLQSLKWTFIAIAAVIGTVLLGAFGLVVAALVIIKAVVEAAVWAWNGLVAVFEWVITAVMKVIQWFSELNNNINQKMTEIQNTVTSKFNEVRSAITNIWNTIMATIFGIVQGIVNWLSNSWNNAYNTIAYYLNATLNFIRNTWNAIYGTIIGIVNGIIGFFGGAWNWLYNAGRNVVQGLINGIWAMGGNLWNGIAGVANNIGRFFAGAGGWLWGAGQQIIQGLINGIGSMAGAVWGKAQEIANGVKDRIKSALNIKSPSRVMVDIGQNISAGLVKGIENGMNDIKNVSLNMAGAVTAPDFKSTASATPAQNTNNIYGNITLGDTAAVDRFFDRLGRNTELAQKGMATI
jgi:hypothetical protein